MVPRGMKEGDWQERAQQKVLKWGKCFLPWLWCHTPDVSVLKNHQIVHQYWCLLQYVNYNSIKLTKNKHPYVQFWMSRVFSVTNGYREVEVTFIMSQCTYHLGFIKFTLYFTVSNSILSLYHCSILIYICYV